MLLGRKKKRENTQSEELENPNNRHLLEYQNKCLITKIEDLKEKLDAKSKCADSLEKRIESLAEVFTILSLEIYNIKETLSKVVIQNGIPVNDNTTTSENEIVSIRMLSNILKDLQNNSNICLNSLTIHDQVKSQIDNISSNLMSLISKLMDTIKHEKKLKSEIETLSYENVQESMANYYNELKLKNEEIQKNYSISVESNKNILKELEVLKGKYTILEENLQKKDKRIEELENQKFNLMRKVNTNPVLPYIKYEKKMFARAINDHGCVCHICGGEMDLTKEKKEDSEMKVDQVNEPTSIISNETLTLLNNENTSLKNRIKDLHEMNEKLRIDSTITEEKLRNSKPFKMLQSEAEQLIFIIDSLKEANSNLIKKINQIIENKDKEISALESKFNSRIEESEKFIYDQRAILESNNTEITNYKIKIESLENLLKMKENEDIQGIFQNYENEKTNMLKLMDAIKKQLKDYERKYEEEFKRNKELEEKILNLEERISFLGGDSNQSVGQTTSIDKRLLKKNDQLKRLEAELKSEKEYKETYIAELEVNEKSISDLSKMVKNLSNQAKEYKEKIAKMMNDKIKDIDTHKKLNKEKEALDGIIEGLKDKIQLESELNSKLKTEISNYKEIVTKFEQDIRFRDEETEIFKTELQKSAKAYEQLKIALERNNAVIKELESTSAKNMSNYDSMKAKFDELCKLKNLDTKQLGKSIKDMEEELEYLQLENNKYRNMVKCNICREKNKDSIVLKCFHMFCKDCMDDTIKSRNRICPVCKAKNITQNEVHPIFWD